MDKVKQEALKSEILDLYVNKSQSYNQILEDLILKYPEIDMYELSQILNTTIGRPKATKLILKRDVDVEIPVESNPFLIKFEPPQE